MKSKYYVLLLKWYDFFRRYVPYVVEGDNVFMLGTADTTIVNNTLFVKSQNAWTGRIRAQVRGVTYKHRRDLMCSCRKEKNEVVFR